MRLIAGFVDTYLRLTPQEELQFEEHVDTVLERSEKAQVMELTTSWEQKGEARLVLRQLQRRWGAVPSDIQDRIRALSVEQLERLAEALLDFRSQEDLDRWLQSVRL